MVSEEVQEKYAGTYFIIVRSYFFHCLNAIWEVLAILWQILALKALKWKSKFKDTVLNIACRLAKTISIALQNPTRDLLRQISFQVLAMPEARGNTPPAAVVLDQAISWNRIQWHLLQRNPDRITFQAENYSCLRTTRNQPLFQPTFQHFFFFVISSTTGKVSPSCVWWLVLI